MKGLALYSRRSCVCELYDFNTSLWSDHFSSNRFLTHDQLADRQCRSGYSQLRRVMSENHSEITH